VAIADPATAAVKATVARAALQEKVSKRLTRVLIV